MRPRRPPRIRAAYVLAPMAVMVALSGTAVAANGGTIGLGQHNAATKPTTLTDKKGTPLALLAKPGRPPLSVSGNTTQVPSLNASLLGGMTATSLVQQDEAFTTPGTATFRVPRGFHHMLVLGSAGGGGGGFGVAGGAAATGGGEGGHVLVWTPVRPGSTWSVVIGAGGSGGTSHAASGFGGTTTVDASPTGAGTRLMTLTGGSTGGDGYTCVPGDTAGTGGAQGGGAAGPGAKAAAAGAVALQGAGGQPSLQAETVCGQPGAGSRGGADSIAGGGGDGGGTGDTGKTPVQGQPGRDGLVIVEFLS